MLGISHDAIIAKLDRNKDGQLTIADIQAAATAAKSDLQAKQTNYFNALVIAGLAFFLGGFVALQVFCRSVPH